MNLVFVGAGGSAAVNPNQYPTTVEFFKRLPGDITQEPLFVYIREFLEARKGQKPIDIEEVLWNLDEFQDYCKVSCDTETIAGWVMAHRINQLTGAPADLSHLRNGMHTLGETQIKNLKDKINALVYNFYAEPPSNDELADWVRLLKGLAERDSIIEIFTTNYDMVLEHAIGLAQINVETGRSFDGIQTRLDTTLWDTSGEPIENKYGRLTKLHGSVDWQHQNGDIVAGNSNFTGNHQKHLILYPGYKGEPDIEPFRKFHEHLKAVVRKTDAAIFVGFSFRDEYINTILLNLPSEVPKLVINKADQLPTGPFLTGCTHFKDGLTAESVESCIWNLSPKSYFNQGNDKYESGDSQGAVADYDKAIQLAPQFADAYYNRGHAKRDLGDFQDAIVDYDEVIKLNSQDAPAYSARAFAKYKLGDTTGSQEDGVKAKELDPNLDDMVPGPRKSNR